MSDYGNPSYWDERYAHEDKCYDWYVDYSQLKPYLDLYIPTEHDDTFEVLIPGCGNSTLGENLYDQGVTNIVNIDISSVVISLMRDLCADKEHMDFAVKDARNLTDYPDNYFSLIIDKGLFDTQLCTQDNVANAQMLLKEMYRVLKPGGTYLMVSHGSPDSRLGYLTRPLTWSVEHVEIEKPKVAGFDEEGARKYHYIYSCTKAVY